MPPGGPSETCAKDEQHAQPVGVARILLPRQATVLPDRASLNENRKQGSVAARASIATSDTSWCRRVRDGGPPCPWSRLAAAGLGARSQTTGGPPGGPNATALRRRDQLYIGRGPGCALHRPNSAAPPSLRPGTTAAAPPRRTHQPSVSFSSRRATGIQPVWPQMQPLPAQDLSGTPGGGDTATRQRGRSRIRPSRVQTPTWHAPDRCESCLTATARASPSSSALRSRRDSRRRGRATSRALPAQGLPDPRAMCRPRAALTDSSPSHA